MWCGERSEHVRCMYTYRVKNVRMCVYVCIYVCVCVYVCAVGDAGFHAQGAGNNAQFKHQMAQFWKQQYQEIERVSGMSTHERMYSLVLSYINVCVSISYPSTCVCVYVSGLLV